MWLQQLLHRRLTSAPHTVALRDQRRDVTWSQLDRDARALAHAIQQNTAPGSRVAVLSANRVEVLVTLFACALTGTIAVPLNPALTDRELHDILDRIAPDHGLTDHNGRQRLARLRPGLPVTDADDVADLPSRPVTGSGAALTDPVMILHTSATTGFPKGVVADQRYFQHQAASWKAQLRPEPATTYLHTSPLCHGSIVIAVDYLAADATVAVLDQFTPQMFLTAVETWKAQHTFLVPTMMKLVLESRQLPDTDLTSLTLVTHGGAPCPPPLAHRAGEAFQAELRTIFGITEGGGPVISLGPDDQTEPAAVPGATCAGLPMPGVTARITTPGASAAPPYEVGTIHLHSQGLMQGYWNDPEATAQTISEGWLNTADLGYRDANGYLWVVNRRSDLILRGAQNVYPAEIEHILRTIPWVTDAAVVPAPHTTTGQTPVAFVQLATPADFDEHQLISTCIRELASYKRPSHFIPIDRLPRNTVGKLLRRPLEQRAQGLVRDL